MKNIIIFCNSSWNIYNFRANLIKKISLDYSVQTISGKDKFSNKIKNLSKSNNINMQNRSMNIFQNLKEILKVRKIIKKTPNNILINFSNKSAIIGTLASFFFENKIINVITGLGSTFTNKNFLKKNFIKFLYIIINLKTDYFVTQNPNDFKFFKEFLFIKKKRLN